ncbi:MAG: hypothetical protein FWH05_08540 [Oscillospiraceae bacterium]|nr:hypothetical protein [Oscillospiraceae bacterium]
MFNIFKKKPEKPEKSEIYVKYFNALVQFLQRIEANQARAFSSDDAIIATMKKIENRQKEFTVQLETIDDFMNGENAVYETQLKAQLEMLISLADSVEDFYRISSESAPSVSLWEIIKKKLRAGGIVPIDDVGVAVDFTRHKIEAVAQDETLPNGYVAKILKCGYIYKGAVYRKAIVVANKINKEGDV